MSLFKVTIYNRYCEEYWTLLIVARSEEEAHQSAHNHQDFGDGDEILHIDEVQDAHGRQPQMAKIAGTILPKRD